MPLDAPATKTVPFMAPHLCACFDYANPRLIRAGYRPAGDIQSVPPIDRDNRKSQVRQLSF